MNGWPFQVDIFRAYIDAFTGQQIGAIYKSCVYIFKNKPVREGKVMEETQIFKNHILCQLGNEEKHFYLAVDLDTGKILVDLQGIPDTAFLCACFDGQPMWKIKIDDETEERNFLNIEWVISEWGGPDKLIELIKKKREEILSSIPNLKIKYFGSPPPASQSYTQNQQ